MNEVDAKARRVLTGRMTDCVSKLIFLLIAQDRERGNRRDELIVAKRLETGDGLRSGTEGKRQCKSEIGVAGLSEMQIAGVEGERTHPSGTKDELLAQHEVH